MESMNPSMLQHILHNKFIAVIGGSVMRSVYKDLVYLLQTNDLVPKSELKAKGEETFAGDTLLQGGIKNGALHNGKNYTEVREFVNDYHLVRFYFVTRCYCNNVEGILRELSQDPMPDVVIMNSCLWDLTRYGTEGIRMYQTKLRQLFDAVRQSLSPKCTFVWATTPPLGSNIKGGVLLPRMTQNFMLRYEVRAANFSAGQLAMDYGFRVLDLHHSLLDLIHWRVKDGIHWTPEAHRYVTLATIRLLTKSAVTEQFNRGDVSIAPLTHKYDENSNIIEGASYHDVEPIRCSDYGIQSTTGDARFNDFDQAKRIRERDEDCHYSDHQVCSDVDFADDYWSLDGDYSFDDRICVLRIPSPTQIEPISVCIANPNHKRGLKRPLSDINHNNILLSPIKRRSSFSQNSNHDHGSNCSHEPHQNLNHSNISIHEPNLSYSNDPSHTHNSNYDQKSNYCSDTRFINMDLDSLYKTNSNSDSNFDSNLNHNLDLNIRPCASHQLRTSAPRLRKPRQRSISCVKLVSTLHNFTPNIRHHTSHFSEPHNYESRENTNFHISSNHMCSYSNNPHKLHDLQYPRGQLTGRKIPLLENPMINNTNIVQF